MGRTTEPGEKEREIIIEPIRRTKPVPKREQPAPKQPKRKKEPVKK